MWDIKQLVSWSNLKGSWNRGSELFFFLLCRYQIPVSVAVKTVLLFISLPFVRCFEYRYSSDFNFFLKIRCLSCKAFSKWQTKERRSRPNFRNFATLTQWLTIADSTYKVVSWVCPHWGDWFLADGAWDANATPRSCGSLFCNLLFQFCKHF